MLKGDNWPFHPKTVSKGLCRISLGAKTYNLTISWVTVSTQACSIDSFAATPLMTVVPAVT
jgi:predicted nuclease with TOPRIM domain